MSNIKNENQSFEAGEALVRGDIVYLNTDNEAVKVAGVEATNAIGIVYAAASEGDQVSVTIKGIVEDVHMLIENTGGSSGYDAPFAYGSLLVISGKAAGTYTEGQALSVITGTGVSVKDRTTIVGKSFVLDAGATPADTYTTGKVYIDFS